VISFFLVTKTDIHVFGSLRGTSCIAMPPSFDYESASSTESFLKQEYFVDLEGEHREPQKRSLWAKIWQHRLSLLAHLTIIAVYTAGFSLLLDSLEKRYEHGPNLVNCEF
jgi:hypothetical protein